MSEHEMRQRIERFLKRRMQMMLAPALGLGMAVAGCQEGKSLYMGPMPDANSGPVPVYASDAGFILPPGPDAALDLASPLDTGSPVDLVSLDTSGEPDAKLDSATEAGPRLDSGVDTGLIAKYMSPLPDGGPIMAPDYMAQMPDAAREPPFGVLYMAQIPG